MDVKLTLNGGSKQSLIIEPWGEEFEIGNKVVQIVFGALGSAAHCNIEIDASEHGFLRIENPSGFCPKVIIDGQEDERPAFSLS